MKFIYVPPGHLPPSNNLRYTTLELIVAGLAVDLKPVDEPIMATRKIERSGSKRKRNPNRWR